MRKFPNIMNRIEIEQYYQEWFEVKERLLIEISSRKPVRRIVSELAIPRKYTGNFALIPENLDLDELLNRFPVTDYFFIEDESGHIRSVNHNGSLGSCFDKERLIHIIGLISSIPAGNKDLISASGFVPINSTILRNYFKDYLSYLDYLLRTGVLVTDNIFMPKEKSLGYKFSPGYENQTMAVYTYLSARDIQYDPISEERYNRLLKRFEHNTLLDYPYLSFWYMQKKLEISPDAIRFSLYNRDSNTITQTQYLAALYNIIALNNKAYNAQIDSNVHRLHSVITNIKKGYRNFLKYDGKELGAVDISNSQPFLLCILFNPDFWNRESDAYINISHLPENIQNMFTPSLISEIRRHIESIPEAELQDYIREASSGNLYEFMQAKFNNPQIDRKRIKTMILITFFSDNRYLNQNTEDAMLKRRFKSLFPEIYKLIELCKKSKKNRFACLLQAIESELILHRCCKRIWDEGRHKIPVFTIHDSIATTSENIEFVKDIMDEELNKAAGVHPTFKIETWSEQN